MPTVLLTLSENASIDPSTGGDVIRRAVARGMECEEMGLDETHISIRLSKGHRAHMLGDLEIEVFGQVYESRLGDRDARANRIAQEVCDELGVECACWINLGMVGYSRVTTTGEEFFSSGTVFTGQDSNDA